MTLEQLREFIVRWIQIEVQIEINEDQDFFSESILDSLTFAQLIAALEEEFKLEVRFSEIGDWTFVRNASGLARWILEKN